MRLGALATEVRPAAQDVARSPRLADAVTAEAGESPCDVLLRRPVARGGVGDAYAPSGERRT